MWRRALWHPASTALALAVACSSGSGIDASVPDSEAAVSDTASDPALTDGERTVESGSDVWPDEAPPGTFLAIPPCSTPAAYVAEPLSITTPANVYSPACLRVAAGTTVTIEASAVHPLDPSSGGSAGNPIPSQLTTATVHFPTPGFYPFHCPEHVDQGMAGVVWVTDR